MHMVSKFEKKRSFWKVNSLMFSVFKDFFGCLLVLEDVSKQFISQEDTLAFI